MRRFHRIALAVFLMSSIAAFANSTNFVQLGVLLDIGLNDGSGDNVGGTISGTGVNLTVGAGTPFDYMNALVGIAPGSQGFGGTTIFFNWASGQLGGQTYDSLGIYLDPVTLNAGAFTFPTNGQDFSVTLPASIDVITGHYTGICPTPTCVFSLSIEPGTLTLSYTYSADTGLYFGSGGLFVSNSVAVAPEPATLGLVGMGLAVVGWRRVRKTFGSLGRSL